MDPTQKTQVVAALIDLIPMLGGALLVVLGGYIGTKHSHRLNSITEKASERRLKLETLVTANYELETWLKKEENYYLYGEDQTLEQSPLARVKSIASLYFPGAIVKSGV